MENMQLLMKKIKYQIVEQNWKHVESLFRNQDERVKLILDAIKESPKDCGFGYLSDLYNAIFVQLFEDHPDDYMDHYMEYLSKCKQCLYVDEWDIVFNMMDNVYKVCEMKYFKKEATPVDQIKDSWLLQSDIKQAKEILDVVLYFKMKLYCIYNKEIINQNKIIASIAK